MHDDLRAALEAAWVDVCDPTMRGKHAIDILYARLNVWLREKAGEEAEKAIDAAAMRALLPPKPIPVSAARAILFDHLLPLFASLRLRAAEEGRDRDGMCGKIAELRQRLVAIRGCSDAIREAVPAVVEHGTQEIDRLQKEIQWLVAENHKLQGNVNGQNEWIQRWAEEAERLVDAHDAVEAGRAFGGPDEYDMVGFLRELAKYKGQFGDHAVGVHGVVQRLKTKIRKLRAKVRKLRERVKAMEETVGPTMPPAPESAENGETDGLQ